MEANNARTNMVFMPTAVDRGMAGTSRLRNFIRYADKSRFRILNIVRDEVEDFYEYEGVEIIRMDFTKGNPVGIFTRIMKLLKARYRKGEKNILFYYDVPHNPLLLSIVYAAKKILGYYVLMDAVEDYRTQGMISDARGNMRIKFCQLVQQRLMGNLADAGIGISYHLMELLNRKLKNKPKAHITVAFDPAALESTLHEAAPDDGVVRIFYGGSLGEKDGLEYLISGFDIARQKNNALRLEFTGKANERDSERVNKLIAASAYSGDILNHGYVEYDEYCNLLSNADILCMTRNNSAFANAGFPYKLGEYLATGKPVIVSRLPEIEKYLDEEDCFFVRPESADDIAAAILNLVNPARRKEIGAHGKRKAYDHFEASQVSADLFNFIDTLN